MPCVALNLAAAVRFQVLDNIQIVIRCRGMDFHAVNLDRCRRCPRALIDAEFDFVCMILNRVRVRLYRVRMGADSMRMRADAMRVRTDGMRMPRMRMRAGRHEIHAADDIVVVVYQRKAVAARKTVIVIFAAAAAIIRRIDCVAASQAC